jgi:cell division transport system permease protein
MDSFLDRWSKSFGMVVYLNEEINKERADALRRYLHQDNDILEVIYISKEHALNELQQTLGTNALILEGLQENPLPASFELKLKNDLLKPAVVRQKAIELSRIPEVDEVEYGEKWLSSLNTIAETMMIGAFVFGCATFIAVTFITYSTIKIFFHRRREEIETLKLLGATRSFIRLPFLIEGFWVGIMGGIISSTLIFAIYSFTSLKAASFMPSLRFIMTPLPFQIYIIVPFAGAFMSLLGSFIAVGKIRY